MSQSSNNIYIPLSSTKFTKCKDSYLLFGGGLIESSRVKQEYWVAATSKVLPWYLPFCCGPSHQLCLLLMKLLLILLSVKANYEDSHGPAPNREMQGSLMRMGWN